MSIILPSQASLSLWLLSYCNHILNHHHYHSHNYRLHHPHHRYHHYMGFYHSHSGDAPVQLDQLLRAKKPLSPCSWASLPPRPIAGSDRVQYFDHNTSFFTSLTSSFTSLFQSSSSSSSSSSSYRTSEWSSWRRVRAILASTVFSTSCRATRRQVDSTILFLVPSCQEEEMDMHRNAEIRYQYLPSFPSPRFLSSLPSSQVPGDCLQQVPIGEKKFSNVFLNFEEKS